jgi:signal transduction histidine kinase
VRFTATVTPPDGTALGDPERLAQVVVNLLDNAARHSPPGGEVEVIARADQAGLVIEVRDEGPGISPEERYRVFERFTRGERATGGGTGLGLAIARWVVDLHGGAIGVVDTPAHAGEETAGCRIRVSLPPMPTTPMATPSAFTTPTPTRS